ncbi:MAG TPA: diguanylate cyclase [Patescibacteria group bacterium]|jgi:diguanylate cyclase (GGDEF)-like protein|nr:diguanylate cyclase [Patescibacteria group bacterium]
MGLRLERDGIPIPEQLRADEEHLVGNIRDLREAIRKKLDLSDGQMGLIDPLFPPLEREHRASVRGRDELILKLFDDIRRKGVEIDERDGIISQMKRDSLTWLLLRAEAEVQLRSALLNEHRGIGCGIEFIDHNEFKAYNDDLCPEDHHSLGDLVLYNTSKRLRDHLRHTDALYRWGGDEYVKLIREVATVTQVGIIAGRDWEVVETDSWENVDSRLSLHPPRLNIGMVFWKHPSEEERERMRPLDSTVEAEWERERLARMKADDTLVLSKELPWTWPVPAGTSYDVIRRLVKVADGAMYEAKAARGRGETAIVQKDTEIVSGGLVEV